MFARSPWNVVVAVVAAVLAACSPTDTATAPEVPAGVARLDLAAAGGLGRAVSGRVHLVDSAQQALLSGWESPPGGGEVDLWSVTAAPEVLVPLAVEPRGEVHLSLDAKPPGFHAGPFSLELELNGVQLGAISLAGQAGPHVVPVPAGTLRLGLNRLRLLGLEPLSPEALGVGADRRKLGFRLGVVELVGEGWRRSPVRVRRLTVPRATGLQWELGPGEGAWELRVQDALNGEVLQARTLTGTAGTVDLAPGGEEDLLLTLWPVPVDGQVAARELRSLEVASGPGYTDVILIVVDTLRGDVLRLVEPPNLIDLASEALIFEHCFAHAPITLPSHTALFSSRLPHDTGIVNNGQNLPPDLPLFAEHLQDRGYETRAVVSLGTLYSPLSDGDVGLDRGFEVFTRANGLDSYAEHTGPLVHAVLGELDARAPLFLFAHFADPHEPYRSQRPSGELVRILLDGELQDEVDPAPAPYLSYELELSAGEHRLAFESPGQEVGLRFLQLKDAAGRKLEARFLEGGLFDFGERKVVAFDLEAAGSVEVFCWLADYPRKEARLERYGEEVLHVDGAIGELIAELKRAGRWEHSLVVFTSDHGEGLGQHGIVGHVEGLYDEQLHVPLLVKLPSGPDWGPVRERLEGARGGLVRHLDLVPTLLDVLGQPPLEGQQGRSLLRGGASAGGPHAVADLVGPDGPVVLSQTHAPEAPYDQYSLRDERYKLIFKPDEPRFLMFDIQADPLELTDVFEARGSERSDWQALLRDLDRRWKREGRIEVDDDMRAHLEALGY